jgi:glyoxylase-like metal-dependent hydrolase (beta-lactamase superfamily II)
MGIKHLARLVTLLLHCRHLSRAIIGYAVGASLVGSVHAQVPTPTFTAVSLTDSVVQIIGGPVNIVVLVQPEGLLLVNGGPKEQVPALQAFLGAQFPGKAVKVMLDTDWHPENTGFNEAAAAAGARIVAHENTKQWLGTTIHCQWLKQTFAPVPKAALPTETFYTTGELTFGREKVVYGYLGQAHTDGDIYVYFPGPNVLVAGDVMTVGSYPILDYTTGGWIGGLASATRTLLDVAKEDTHIVPGRGPVQARTDLAAESDMLSAMRDKLVKMMKSGMGSEEMITAAPTKDFDAKWGDPQRFMQNVYQGLWWHARDLGGVI